MKVLIVNNMAPFIWGGAEELAKHLEKNIILSGHEAEILRIPFQWEPATRIPSQIMLARTLQLYDGVDRVIALKFPAYLIQHPHKTLWLLHQYRQAYDLYDAGQSNLSTSEEHNDIRALIKAADNQAFHECKKVFTNSEVTKERLLKYNQFSKAKVLLPPLNDPELFCDAKLGDYIFAGGRVNPMKRQYLLLEALQYTDKKVKLIIAGPPDCKEYIKTLEDRVSQLKLQDRVILDLQFLPRERYAEYVNHARAVAYLPFDEDALGYVTMEAAVAGKALISATDSGGVLALAKHLQTGWVTEPNPAALAEAMSAAFNSTAQVKKYGKAAKELWQGLGINWNKTIEILLE